MLENLISYLKSNNTHSKAPYGVCPNCWGHQEYEGKLYELMKLNNVDANNIDEKQAFIQKFVTNQMDGIILQKNSEHLVCVNCDSEFNETTS